MSGRAVAIAIVLVLSLVAAVYIGASLGSRGGEVTLELDWPLVLLEDTSGTLSNVVS